MATSNGGQTTVMYIDRSTGLLVMTESPGVDPMTQEDVTQRVYIDEWATHDGLKIPVTMRMTNDDKPFATFKVTAFELNPSVDPKLFRR